MVDYQVGSGTLWIKLKISENDVLEDHNKQDHQYEDEDVEVQIPKHDDNRRRICDVCNKGFSSGKALGGHMRIHVQAAKKHLISGKKDKKSKPLVTTYYKKRILQRDEEEDLGNYNNDRLLPTCSICGKNFPSMKSLFGHMRCHPERAWRGIQPPHLKSRNEIHKKTASAPATVAVPGWSVTAKRGRKPNAEEAINSCSKDEEQLHDAVHHLMLLAKGDSVESGLTGGGGCVNKHNDIPEELEKTNSNSLTSKAENEEFAYHHISESKMIDNRKRRKKKMKIRFLNSVQESASVLRPARAAASSSEKYKCSTCGKSFATYQALGGHKSSHNKFSMVIQNSDVTNVAPATSEEAAATSSSKLLADSKLCYFPTSRCQWRSPIDHQIGPSSSQLTSPGEFNHTTGRRILDFDLNELPSDHEDELAGNHEYFSFFPI